MELQTQALISQLATLMVSRSLLQSSRKLMSNLTFLIQMTINQATTTSTIITNQMTIQLSNLVNSWALVHKLNSPNQRTNKKLNRDCNNLAIKRVFLVKTFLGNRKSRAKKWNRDIINWLDRKLFQVTCSSVIKVMEGEAQEAKTLEMR